MYTILNINSIAYTQISNLAFTENEFPHIPNNIYVHITLRGSSLDDRCISQMINPFCVHYLDIFTNNGIDWIYADNVPTKRCDEYPFLYFFVHNTTKRITYPDNGQI